MSKMNKIKELAICNDNYTCKVCDKKLINREGELKIFGHDKIREVSVTHYFCNRCRVAYITSNQYFKLQRTLGRQVIIPLLNDSQLYNLKETMLNEKQGMPPTSNNRLNKKRKVSKRLCQDCDNYIVHQNYCRVHLKKLTRFDFYCKRFTKVFVKIYPGGGLSPR